MIWYEACFGRISKVEIVRTTEKFVVRLSGSKDAKDSDWKWYRPTFEEAKAAMLASAKRELDMAKMKLAAAEKGVRSIESLTEAEE